VALAEADLLVSDFSVAACVQLLFSFRRGTTLLSVCAARASNWIIIIGIGGTTPVIYLFVLFQGRIVAACYVKPKKGFN